MRRMNAGNFKDRFGFGFSNSLCSRFSCGQATAERKKFPCALHTVA
jgi:hypothetical protein